MKKVGLGLLACGIASLIIYGVLLWLSVRKIDAFCARLEIGASEQVLLESAREAGLEIRGPVPSTSGAGHYFSIASSYTLGDYACRIRSDGNVVVKRGVGSH